MKFYKLIMLFSFFFNSKAVAQKDTFIVKKEFQNQGEQENYLAEKIFQEKYKKYNYETYNKPIQIDNDLTFRFDSTYVILAKKSQKLSSIFKLGILFPDLFTYKRAVNDTLKINHLEELEFLKLPPTKKRFWLWFSEKGSLNIVYLFELTNEKASIETNLESFLRDATLTFFKHGWVID